MCLERIQETKEIFCGGLLASPQRSGLTIQIITKQTRRRLVLIPARRALLAWQNRLWQSLEYSASRRPMKRNMNRRENVSFSVGAANGRIHSSPTGQRFKFRCRTLSEIKNDPTFSRYLLKWPPAESNLKPALKKNAPVGPVAPVRLVRPVAPVTPVAPVQEHTEGQDHHIDLSIAGMSSTLKAPRVNFKTRTVSEIRRDPHFSKFLLKWPPESSGLNPFPKTCGTNRYPENWEKDVKKGHKLVGRFDLRKVGMPSTKPCETLTQATHEDAKSIDFGRLRIPSQPQPQQRLLGGSESPDSCEHFMSRYTLKSGTNSSEASWETESKECPEDLSSVQSHRSGIQYRAAEVSKHLENVTTAKVYWTNDIKELENEAKTLEKELKEMITKSNPESRQRCHKVKECAQRSSKGN